MSNGLIFWISASWVIRAYIPNFSLLGDQETSGQPRNWFGRNYLLKVLVFWIPGSSFWEIWHPWMLAFWKWCHTYNWSCSPWSWFMPHLILSHHPLDVGGVRREGHHGGPQHVIEVCIKIYLLIVVNIPVIVASWFPFSMTCRGNAGCQSTCTPSSWAGMGAIEVFWINHIM